MQEGDIKTLDGKTVGTHSGVFYYTVGQRKGFGLGGAGNGEPWYVVKKTWKTISFTSIRESAICCSQRNSRRAASTLSQKT